MAEQISAYAPLVGFGVILYTSYKMYESQQAPTAVSRAKAPKRSNAPKAKAVAEVNSAAVHAKGTAPGAANADKRKKKASATLNCLAVFARSFRHASIHSARWQCPWCTLYTCLRSCNPHYKRCIFICEEIKKKAINYSRPSLLAPPHHCNTSKHAAYCCQTALLI